MTTIMTAQIIAGNNDRKFFASNKLEELAASIKEHGLIQPITVREIENTPDGKRYEIVAGERRFRAVSLLGWDEIPANVMSLDDEEASAVMLLENTARQDLDAIEEAQAYKARIDRFGWTVDEVARRAGVSTIRVKNVVKLLSLRPEIQHLVKQGSLTIGYAQIIVNAGLNYDFQLIAIKALNENAAPTIAWFRKVCGELEAKQKQASLFDLSTFAQDVYQKAANHKNTMQDIPHPSTHKAPVTSRSVGTAIRMQIKFWKDAAEKWMEAGKSLKAKECEIAAASLQNVLSIKFDLA